MYRVCSVYLVWIRSLRGWTRACTPSRARGVDGYCSVASSYATLHIHLTYKYNDVTIRTTLLPRVSIQRDATRRFKGEFLFFFHFLFFIIIIISFLWNYSWRLGYIRFRGKSFNIPRRSTRSDLFLTGNSHYSRGPSFSFNSSV